MSTPTLAEKMRKLAETHPNGEALRKAADDLDVNTVGFYGTPQTVTVGRFVGSWARARRLWCDATGERLI